MGIARRLSAISLAVLCALFPTTSAYSENLEPCELNALIPLTDSGAFLGKSYVETFRAIEQLINATGGIKGRPINFVTADTQTNGQIDVQLVNALIAKKVPVFIDGAPSIVCLPSLPLVEKNGPVDYCLSAAIHPAGGSYVFSTNASTADSAAVAVRYLRERGLKRLAMLTSTDSTGQDYDRQIAVVLSAPENRGVQLVMQEHFNPTDISVNAQLSRLKSASPQALLIYSTGTPFGTALHGAHDIGFDVPVMTFNPNMTYAQMAAYAAFLPKELDFTSLRSLTPDGTLRGPLRDAQAVYLKAYRSIGVRPEAGDVLAWDPCMIVLDALRHLGTGTSARQIRDYILHLHGWIGAKGVYDFSSGDQRGIGQNSVVIARWSTGENTWLQVRRPRGFLK